jgi:DNA-binding response OmpR family regulator
VRGAILIVEDEPVTQRLIAAGLERAGFEVMRAANVEEAAEAIRTELPGLMLLDWVLPTASGVSFLRELRNDRRTKQMPIRTPRQRRRHYGQALGHRVPPAALHDDPPGSRLQP